MHPTTNSIGYVAISHASQCATKLIALCDLNHIFEFIHMRLWPSSFLQHLDFEALQRT